MSNKTDSLPAETLSPPANRLTLLAILGLLILVLIPFQAVRDFDFIAFDDHEYVYENPHVLQGLSPANIRWAFTSLSIANWHPLSWLSHELDVSLFGLNPGGHHLPSLLFHLACTALLFLLVRRWTGRTWGAFLLAAIWAVHPQRAESVVWISERKDVLSLFFGLGALWAYTRGAEFVSPVSLDATPSPRDPPGRAGFWAWYPAVFILFALGLMAKPMLVTFPFLLLVLDWGIWRRFGWPRQNRFTWVRPVVEKIPLFLLSLASSIVTYVAQNQGAVVEIQLLPLPTRFLNAALAYVAYVGKTVWPFNLAVYYPYTVDQTHPWLLGLTALALLIGITVGVSRSRYRWPLLLAGWLWFLGTLVPVIGVVQVGSQAMADRYSYLPSIGLWLMVLGYVPSPSRAPHRALAFFPLAILVLFLVLTHAQVATWRNTTTLFEHALHVTKNNDLAHYSLGKQLELKGFTNEAATHFESTLAINSNYYEAHLELGNIAGAQGDLEAAAQHYAAVLRLAPQNLNAWLNLGMTAREAGDLDLADKAYTRAQALAPTDPEVYYFTGILWVRRNNLAQAQACFEKSVELKPDFADGWNSLGKVAFLSGRLEEALRFHRQAASLNPGIPEYHLNMGLVYERMGEDGQALKAFARAANLKPDYGDAFACLGNLMLKYGKREDAIRLYERAVEIDPRHPGYRQNLSRARGNPAQPAVPLDRR